MEQANSRLHDLFLSAETVIFEELFPEHLMFQGQGKWRLKLLHKLIRRNVLFSREQHVIGTIRIGSAPILVGSRKVSRIEFRIVLSFIAANIQES